MKATRTVPFAAALALAALGAAALTPAVQTWAARRVLARAGARLGSASLGYGRAELRGVTLQVQGMTLSVPYARARLGVAMALLGRGYHLTELSASGWTLDLSRARPLPEAGEAMGFPWLARALGGALAAFKARGDLVLDGADLEGDVILPGGRGRPSGRVHVILSGGGLAPGAEGRFAVSASASAEDPAAPVSAVRVKAELTAAMDPAGAFTRASLRADAAASGRDVPSGITLSCEASASRSAGREAYSVSLRRGAERVASLEATGRDGTLGTGGSWRLDLRDTDLAPFALGRALPAFYAAGEGGYEADPASGKLRVTGRLRASLDRLEVVRRRLGAFGRVGVAADFDVARSGHEIRVSRLDVSLTGPGPVASVRALQSFEFDDSTGELKVAVPSDDLVGISVLAAPVAWLKAIFPTMDPSGGAVRGELVLRAEDGRLVLRTKAPLAAQAVSVARAGRPLAAGVDLSAFVLADLAPQGWQLQLAPLTARLGGVEMLSLDARIGSLATGAAKAAGTWSASLPLLLSIPAARALPRLSGGEASGSFEANLDSTREVRVKLAVRGLSYAARPGAELPTLSAEIRADLPAGGRAEFSVPLRLGYGDRSVDVLVAGTAGRGAQGRLFDVTLSGTRLEEGDAMALLGLAGGYLPVPQPAALTPVPAAAAARPFWPAVQGSLEFHFEEIVLPRADLKGAAGRLYFSQSAVSLSEGSVSVDGAKVALSGRLAFEAGAAAPYSLSAHFDAEGIDAAAVFRGFRPDDTPMLEGIFDATGHVYGSGAGAGDLLSALQGSAKLTSRGGSFRALRADIADSLRQSPSKIAGAIDTVASLFSRKSENIGAVLVDAARDISDIRYDQMSVTAERGSDLDLRLTQISLIAPEERLNGTGRISHAQDVPLEDQPLTLDFDVAARGRLARGLDLVGLLRDQPDDLGYTPLYQPVHLGGTLRHVDDSQWRDMLVQAPLRKGTGLIDKLLRK